MSGFSETAVEDTSLEWLAPLGYDVPYGPQIVADILPAQVTAQSGRYPQSHSEQGPGQPKATRSDRTVIYPEHWTVTVSWSSVDTCASPINIA